MGGWVNTDTRPDVVSKGVVGVAGRGRNRMRKRSFQRRAMTRVQLTGNLSHCPVHR